MFSLCSWNKKCESEDVTHLRLFSCSFVAYLILTKLFQFFRGFSELSLERFMTNRQTGTYTVLERMWCFRMARHQLPGSETCPYKVADQRPAAMMATLASCLKYFSS